MKTTAAQLVMSKAQVYATEVQSPSWPHFGAAPIQRRRLETLLNFMCVDACVAKEPISYSCEWIAA